jgi:Glycosyl hydrolases family 35/Beta-galactosidase jelly roll domain
MRTTIILLAAWVFSLVSIAAADTPRISYDSQCFQIDGKDVLIYSGCFHYFRCPKPLWADRLARLKGMGCNCVETYVPWNWHEQSPPASLDDFSKVDMTDLTDFLDLATNQFGLNVILRPGPYICAEWDGGGYPQWLQTKRPADHKTGQWVRLDDPTYLAWCKHWYEAVAKVAVPWQITHRPAGKAGVILWQIENEYNYFSCPAPVKLRQLLALGHDSRDLGIDVPLITCWTEDDSFRKDDFLRANVIECHNTYPRLDPTAEVNDLDGLAKYQPDKPRMITELQGGWFSNIGANEKLSEDQDFITPEQITHVTLLAWAHGFAATSYYMAYGGTNFGDWGSSFRTQSYDYGAPLREWGGVGSRYFACQGMGALVRDHGAQLARSAPDEIANSDSIGPNLSVISRRAVDGSRFVFVINNDSREPAKGQIILDIQGANPVKLDLAYDLGIFDAKMLYLPARAMSASQGQWLPAPAAPPARPAATSIPDGIVITKALTKIDPGPTSGSWQDLPPGGTVEDAGIYDRRFVYYRAGVPAGGKSAFIVNLPEQDSFIATLNGSPLDVERHGQQTIGAFLPLASDATSALMLLYENGGRDNGGDKLDERCGLHEPMIVDGGEFPIPVADWIRRTVKTVSAADASPDLDDSKWKAQKIDKGANELRPHTAGVFRAHFNFDGSDLTRTLTFGRMAGDIQVFINGQLAPPVADRANCFDISGGLQSGKNVLAVLVTATDSKAGIGGGAEIASATTAKSLDVHWQISGQTTGLVERWFDPNLDDSQWQSVALSGNATPTNSINLTWTRLHFALPAQDAHVWVPWKLHLDAAGNGYVYLNGHNLGRWWEVGPQHDYYLPECWLNFGPGSQNVLAFCLRPTAAGAAVKSASIEPYADFAEAR